MRWPSSESGGTRSRTTRRTSSASSLKGLTILFPFNSAFVRNPRQVLSRDQLLELVWGNAYGVSGDQVKLYVGYLRRKLDPEQPESVPIETVRGFGYRYGR